MMINNSSNKYKYLHSTYCVPKACSSPFRYIPYLVFMATLWGSYFIIAILQMKVKYLVQGHLTSKGWCWDSNPSLEA